MLRKVLVVVGFVILGHLLLTQPVEARYDYELGYYRSQDAESRDAADAEDWIERGRASVTDSPVFRDGIRLTASAVEEGEQFEPGVASAIYRFVVPEWAHYLKISVRYKDASKDDEVAGRLWIRTVDNETKKEIDQGAEVPFYGDTFVLRSEQTSETFHVPSGRHVEDSRLEMHIVAEGKDCLDVKYIRVEYLQKKPAGMVVVHRVYNDYWYRWPRHRYVYHYYYWGPCYWPRAYLVYEWWDWPCGFYWTVWRPWFRLHVRVHYGFPWWGPRRYTDIYHCDPHDPPARKRALFRSRLLARHVGVEKIKRSQLLFQKPIRAPSHTRTVQTQEVRLGKQISSSDRLAAKRGFDRVHRRLDQPPARVGKGQQKVLANHQPVVKKHQQPRHSVRATSRSVNAPVAKKKIGEKNQEHVQQWKTPRITRPKSVGRENSSVRPVQIGQERSRKKIWRQTGTRTKRQSRTHVENRTSPGRLRSVTLGRTRR